MDWNEFFANNSPGKGLLSRIYTVLSKPNSKETTPFIKKKWAKDLNRYFTKKNLYGI